MREEMAQITISVDETNHGRLGRAIDSGRARCYRLRGAQLKPFKKETPTRLYRLRVLSPTLIERLDNVTIEAFGHCTGNHGLVFPYQVSGRRESRESSLSFYTSF